MINVGIYDGDYVVVQKQPTAHNGQIVAALVRDQETEPVRMPDDPPAHHIHAIDQAVAAATVAQQLAVALHRSQALAQGIHLLTLF